MDHLLTTARNITITTHDSKGEQITQKSEIITEPMIEMVLTTYHKEMELIEGNLLPIKKLKTHRITLHINAALTLATHLQEWATEAQTIKNKLQESNLQCEKS
jgi:hypothetical protein